MNLIPDNLPKKIQTKIDSLTKGQNIELLSWVIKEFPNLNRTENDNLGETLLPTSSLTRDQLKKLSSYIDTLRMNK